MDNRHSAKRRRASAFLEAIERRDNGRNQGAGELSVFWHHDPSRVCCYETIDASSTGARLRTGSLLPEGMTGVAMDLADDGREYERVAMVVWSRTVRDAEGNASHHEAGIRFL